MAQKSLFGMNVLSISGGHEYISHVPTQIVDVNGNSTSNSDYEEFRAPFDCKVVAIHASNGNSVIFESIDNVYTPKYPGIAKKLSFRCTHMNNAKFNTFTYAIDKTFKQGAICYYEGNKLENDDSGKLSNGETMGNHIHLEFAFGEYRRLVWETNSGPTGGVYRMETDLSASESMVNLKDACFIVPGTVVKNNGITYVNNYVLTLVDGTTNSYLYYANNGTASSLTGVYLVGKNGPFNIRATAGTGTILTTVPKGSEAEILEFLPGFILASDNKRYQWAKTKYNGYTGYSQLDLHNDYLIRKASTSSKIYLKAIVGGFRVRNAPVTGAELTFVPQESRAEIIYTNTIFESDGFQWPRVMYNGTSGFSQMDTVGYYQLERE